MMEVTMPVSFHKACHKVSPFFCRKTSFIHLSWTWRMSSSYMDTNLPKQPNLTGFFWQQPIILSNKESFSEVSEKIVSFAKKTNLATEWWFLHFQEHSSNLMCPRIRTMFLVFQILHFLCKICFFRSNSAPSETGISWTWWNNREKK